jgi:serine protease AprX
MSIRRFIIPCIITSTVLVATLLTGAAPRGESGSVTKYNIWVYLVDHGERSSAELAEAIRSAPVSARSLERRRARGAISIRDVYDVPVHTGYLNRIRETGCIVKRTSKYLNAVSVVATPKQISEIRRLPFVKKIDPVGRYHRKPGFRPAEIFPQGSTTERSDRPKPAAALDYGNSFQQINQINVVPLHDEGIDGEGVMVGVFDTGFNRSHVALQHLNVEAEWDFIFDDGNTRNEAGDVSNQDYHGTQVLSAMAAYSPGNLIGPAYAATFVLAKTERMFEEVQGEEDDFVRALEWADSIGVDVVSSSLGYFDWYTPADMDGNTAVTTIACDIAAGKGITICMAAGNENGSAWGHIIAPSDGDSVIAVGAVDETGVVAAFSSRGPSADGRIKPDVAARGVATWCVTPWDSLSYTTSSGTSLSTPLVGGACALLLDMHPQWGPIDVRTALRNEASNSGSPDNDIGWGIIDTYQSALAGATGIMENVSLDLSLSGNTVVGRIFNGQLADRTVDVARRKQLPGRNGWGTTDIVAHGIVVPGSSLSTFNDPLASGGVYEYRLHLSDDASTVSSWIRVKYSLSIALAQSAPNPFVVGSSGEVVIRYAVGGVPPDPNDPPPIGSYTDLSLEIFDVRGARVATLAEGIESPGEYTARWNGRNDRGDPVASGVYFYRLRASGQVLTRKLVLIRR